MTKPRITSICLFLCLLFTGLKTMADDGYKLWLNYQPINDPLAQTYKTTLRNIVFPANSQTLRLAKKELLNGLKDMLNHLPQEQAAINNNTLVVSTLENIPSLNLAIDIKQLRLKEEGFMIKQTTVDGATILLIIGQNEIGTLYGIFHFLQLLQTHRPISHIDIKEEPHIKHRVLNHWDNLDGSVERGYAGHSLWNWHKLPDYIDQRYVDYARANASVGINGTVLTNVNANALTLTERYLEKAAALAEVFRPYGIKVYLTARFSAPLEIGGLNTADPLDSTVIQWWHEKIQEIYKHIPDFGGFLVKANSEGQPGPQNYGRDHAEGANVLAKALQPHGGIVMWRAFVYDDEVPDDRAKQAYSEFQPLDGEFAENVIVQVKNGAIDFQPREPFHPLFGAMPQTPLMMEFQLTQEYLGFATHLAYLGPLFEETLQSDTYSKGEQSYVYKVIEGSLDEQTLTAMAGVANIGSDRNWTGHPFGQANWYAYGKFAWNPNGSAAEIAANWIRLTFTNDQGFVKDVQQMMMESRETIVRYMTPLGLHHLMGWDHHYGPGPWIKDKARADWTSVYYHNADEQGIGFDRTSTGSNALSQYADPVRKKFEDLKTCPEEFILWFHHLPWTYQLRSGESLWEALCQHYDMGVQGVKDMQETWGKQRNKVDKQRFNQIDMLLSIQLKEAQWWRDACLAYFQSQAKKTYPKNTNPPLHPLNYYENLQFHYVPGI
ncbi:alpha-glucuronidase [Olivibacter sp. SDN3]|uniref:alpha-glucuronidase family glycosyl hydrolase n=1 Tax=Olivibacter sp. SDN3 TaxID=2764720 RepID=UPI001651AA44|nr:alpha-glucuronidase family glycosyl hydrolase [Olivibacter sp. SDN3]QNL49325.1 alpha-glucuronidase [Olivibacter sp. SDN3]